MKRPAPERLPAFERLLRRVYRASPPPGRAGWGASGDRDRRARVHQVDPGEAWRKVHRIAIGREDLERLLGIGEVPFRRIAMTLSEDVGRAGPLQVKVDGRRAQHVGESRVVVRHLDQDYVHRFDRLASVLVDQRSQFSSIGIGGLRGGIGVGHAMEVRLVEYDAVGRRGSRAGGRCARSRQLIGDAWGVLLHALGQAVAIRVEVVRRAPARVTGEVDAAIAALAERRDVLRRDHVQDPLIGARKEDHAVVGMPEVNRERAGAAEGYDPLVYRGSDVVYGRAYISGFG